MALEKENKRGAKKKSKSALLRQSIETVRETVTRLIEASSDESTSEGEDW
jgi:hypothetical protein